MKRIRKKGIGALVSVTLLAAAVGLFGIVSPPPSQTPVRAAKQPVKIGFIGDSITYGKGGTRTAVQVEIAELGSNYVGVNRAVNGTTTKDWLPGTQRFDQTAAVFKRQGVSVVSIMLGTNDASKTHRISPQQYRKNLLQIIDGLRNQTAVRNIILNYPPYVVPKPGWHWNKKSIWRLREYAAVINLLADGKFVLLGDTTALEYFSEHPEELADGVHPNDTGYYRLGQLWAAAFKQVAGKQNDMPAFLAKTQEYIKTD